MKVEFALYIITTTSARTDMSQDEEGHLKILRQKKKRNEISCTSRAVERKSKELKTVLKIFQLSVIVVRRYTYLSMRSPAAEEQPCYL